MELAPHPHTGAVVQWSASSRPVTHSGCYRVTSAPSLSGGLAICVPFHRRCECQLVVVQPRRERERVSGLPRRPHAPQETGSGGFNGGPGTRFAPSIWEREKNKRPLASSQQPFAPQTRSVDISPDSSLLYSGTSVWWSFISLRQRSHDGRDCALDITRFSRIRAEVERLDAPHRIRVPSSSRSRGLTRRQPGPSPTGR
jgi:hypothetical protein